MKEHVRRKIKFFANLALSNSVTHNALQAIPFWFASLVVGLLAVFYTKLFTHAEDLLHAALRWRSWSLLIITPLSFCLAWLVVVMFAPQARGSGIPQVMAAIDMAPTKNENKVNLLLSLKVVVVKIISSLLMVLGGGAIGREGPTIQIAGSAFHVIRRWVPASTQGRAACSSLAAQANSTHWKPVNSAGWSVPRLTSSPDARRTGPTCAW